MLAPPHLPRLQRAGKGWLRVIKERDRKTLLKELSGKGAISGLLCASARDLGPEQTIAERSSGLLQQAPQPDGCEGHEEQKGPLLPGTGTKPAPSGERRKKDPQMRSSELAESAPAGRRTLQTCTCIG